jgi:hypothetical protein
MLTNGVAFSRRPMPGVLAAHHRGRRAGHDVADGGAGVPGEGQEGQEKIVIAKDVSDNEALSVNHNMVVIDRSLHLP